MGAARRRRWAALTVLYAGFLAVAGACTRAAYVPSPLASAPCTVPGYGSPSEPWREVHASGFTFCVPGSWRPSGDAPRGLDARVWSGPDGAVAWATTAAMVPVVTRDCVTIRNARTWQAMGPTTCTTTSNVVSECAGATRSSEEVGGLTIDVTQAECQGAHVTTATGPGIYLRAAADRADVAALELSLVRSIRIGR